MKQFLKLLLSFFLVFLLTSTFRQPALGSHPPNVVLHSSNILFAAATINIYLGLLPDCS
ncbi:hypothetical protein F4779DRAFT_594279 [Xylariaceae sp. FL0662B]|nr:hypothetical protein F4779DRAFT_594279 [Xylariaceae sp. FL0662B]